MDPKKTPLHEDMLRGFFTLPRDDYAYLVSREFWENDLAICVVHGVADFWFEVSHLKAGLGYGSGLSLSQAAAVIQDAVDADELVLLDNGRSSYQFKSREFVAWCLKRGWKLPEALGPLVEKVQSAQQCVDEDEDLKQKIDDADAVGSSGSLNQLVKSLSERQEDSLLNALLVKKYSRYAKKSDFTTRDFFDSPFGMFAKSQLRPSDSHIKNLIRDICRDGKKGRPGARTKATSDDSQPNT